MCFLTNINNIVGLNVIFFPDTNPLFSFVSSFNSCDGEFMPVFFLHLRLSTYRTSHRVSLTVYQEGDLLRNQISIILLHASACITQRMQQTFTSVLHNLYFFVFPCDLLCVACKITTEVRYKNRSELSKSKLLIS